MDDATRAAALANLDYHKYLHMFDAETIERRRPDAPFDPVPESTVRAWMESGTDAKEAARLTIQGQATPSQTTTPE